MADSSPTHPERPPIPPLTALRFFAAALVVTFHYDANRFTRLPDFMLSWLETGYEAVSFFFLLSGFVLSYVYFRADGSRAIDRLPAFFAARIGRLMPALYVSLIIALPFFLFPGFFYPGDERSSRLGFESLLVLTGLQAWVPSAALAWNPPAWSVSVELFMYATFPLVLAAMRIVPAAAMLVGSYLLVVVVALLQVWLMSRPVDSELWYNFTHFFPLFHLPVFIFGAALGRTHLLTPKLPPAAAAWMFAAGIIGLMIMLFELDGLPLRIRSSAILVIFFALIVYGASQPGHLAYRMLLAPPLLYLGDISYSIYALHQPLEYWWDWGGLRAHDIDLVPGIDFGLYFIAVIAAAALCYRYVETPLRRRIRSWVR
jgi:peptidoglycan/LPS O-acetylase OafA/YrhL